MSYGGVIVVDTLNDERWKGPTLAFDSTDLMQPSAGVPAAGPETDTLWTLPVEAKTIVARDGAS
jgi:hypothetical protein